MVMKFAMFIFLLIGLARSSSLDDWETWKKTYGKEYSSIVEENKRYDIFLENNKIIAQHNAQPYHSHLMKINQFSDLTPQEFKDKMLMKSLPNMTEIKRVFKSKKLAGLPKKWDWRLEGAVTPVKEQGSCGSCWTFSTAGTLEGFQYLKTGHLVPLSEQNLLDCNLEDEWGCDGGWPATALEFVKENGIVTEEAYPYNGKVQTCRYNPDNDAGVSFGDVVMVAEGEERDLMEALFTQGPISVCIDGSHLHNYGSGIIMDGCEPGYVDHAVLLVGYGSENDQDFWLLKNSWGTDWGEKGYYKLARNRNNLCSVASYGIFPVE